MFDKFAGFTPILNSEFLLNTSNELFVSPFLYVALDLFHVDLISVVLISYFLLDSFNKLESKLLFLWWLIGVLSYDLLLYDTLVLS